MVVVETSPLHKRRFCQLLETVNSMSDVVDEKTLLRCFRDPMKPTATDGERALRLLSRSRRPDQVREIRDQEVDDHYDSSHLHYACRNGWNDVSRELVDKYQCDPHLMNRRSYTSLHYACEGGNVGIVKFLIVYHHCDLACHGWEGRTPLHCACGSGKLDIVKFLVEECKCDPKVQDWHGDTPLHCASQRGNIDIARFLISVDHHCDPTCCGWKGRTPLHYACGSGKLGIVKFLVEECHCDPRVQDKRSGTGITPLHLACQENGTVDIVKYLITDQNCDPACVTWLGVTPLHYACSSGKLDIVKFLVEECHCDLSEHDIQGTPLHGACLKSGSKDIVRLLVVDHHCDPESRGRWGRTPLHCACSSGKLDIVKFLVEDCNCDLNIRDDNDKTPLHCACEGGKIDIVRFLVGDCKCDPAGRGEWGRTPLHYACYSGKLNVVKFLVEECHCDPGVQNCVGNTPLHLACRRRGSIDIVRFLIVDCHCDPACRGWLGRTPLHCACGSGKLDVVKFLVEECHCNLFQRKDYYGDSPLYTATLCNDILLFLISRLPPLKLVNSVTRRKSVHLLEVFRKCRTEYPLESAFKIFVLGNHGAGKSTLVKVIENEFTSSYGSFAGQWRNISESAVVPLTAGIIPVSIESRRLGQIVIYDMAGHYQYYSSHAALLRSLVSSSAGMFLVVVSLNQEKEEIIRQLQYWKLFIDNCCSNAGTPLRVAVFSHADKVTVDKPERKSSKILEAQPELLPSFSEVVTLDCRKLASSGLTKIRTIVARYSAALRRTFRVDFAVQLLYAFVSSRLGDQIACTVSKLQSLIKQEQGEDSIALKIEGREILPTIAAELSQHLATLSDKGQFLFLRNARKVEDSWVVIDKAVLLSEVNGTVFAPDNFKQHYNISNSTGVVPFSKLKQVFPKRDPDMVVAFLRHLEFCQEISEPEVSLISSRHFRCSCGPMERFFFFPALVSEERPSGASEAIDTPSYRFGWTLQCSQPHQFLTPQFLHVLLLRLAFSFALAYDNTHEVQVSLVIERRCFVWKNGICWLRNGIKTTVEVIEQNTAVLMTISCHRGREMECVKHRSQAVKCILEAKEDLCPAVAVKESLIHPSCFTSTIDSSPKLFSLSELVRTLMVNDSELVSHSGEVSVEIEQLLYFEPYACFSTEILRELLVDKSEDSSDQPVSTYDMSKACRTKVNQLKQVLGIDNTNFQAALARAPPFQRDQPEYQCKLVFQVWKESTQSPTYGALTLALDKYSVFNGRNILVSVRICGCLVLHLFILK